MTDLRSALGAQRLAGALWLSLFIGCIFGANWAIATFGFVPVGFGLMAPAGVYFAGLTFTFRDLAHEAVGRRWVIVAIVIGAVISVAVSPRFALASGIAFLLSELADLSVYSPLRERHWLGAVAASNTVGLVVDSALFLWLAFGSLEFLAGQVVGKAWMTALAVLILWRFRALSVGRLGRRGALDDAHP
jgi:uncharacterized PurR-regulated membrane protein YhhQ (DUF165 family)